MDSRDFFQHIDHAALGEGFFQAAKVRGLLAKRCQPLPQSGIIGLNVGGVLALVEQFFAGDRHWMLFIELL